MSKFRYDRTLRVVMWMDALLSAALAVLSVVASPIIAALSVPHRYVLAVGLSAIVLALLLAAFGAITGVLLMLRLRAGQYALPAKLTLPLPAAMRPNLDHELTASR